MKYTFACKRVPLNDSIKEYAQKKISKLERYFREEDTTAFVTFSVEKDHLCSVEITIRGGATLLRAQTEAPDGDMRGAIDAAVGYIVKPMSPEEAILQMNLLDHSFFVFRSSEDDGLSIVYRRKNGGYGLIVTDEEE